MKSKSLNKILIVVLGLICSFAFSFVGFNFKHNQTSYASTSSAVQLDHDIDYESIVELKLAVSSFNDKQDLTDFADKNEYAYFEQNENYCFYNKYALKQLTVVGKFDSSKYNNVKHLGKTTTMLCFETIEQTKQAYFELVENKNLVVNIEQIIQSAINDDISAQAVGWGYSAIDVNPYKQYITEAGSNEEMVVAVIDTGINTSHTMFKNRILIDDSGNLVGITHTTTTYTYSGYSFEDDNGHGTHVAGIICDTTPSNVKILPVKLLGAKGEISITTSVYYTLFEKIAELKKKYNIVCVNMSLGGETNQSSVDTVEAYMQEQLLANNILPIVAAGNESQEINNNYLPGCCPSAVTVSAVKRSGSNYLFDSSYSNYGSCVDVAAPGTAIRSAWINSSNGAGPNKYATAQGTSMATPYVSAVVTLLCLDPIYANAPRLTTVEQRVYSLAVDLGDTGKDIYYGYGMLSLKGYKGGVEYTVHNTIANYDGDYHNISLTITNVETYSVKFGFSYDSVNISDITTNDNFKNWTNGSKQIYFLISAENMTDTLGYAYLQINKATRQISILNQSGKYGDTPSLNQSMYSLNESLYGSDSLGLELTTTATNSSATGEYDITYSWTNTNYELTTAVAGKYTVEKREIRLMLNTQNTVYGDDIVLDKNAYTIISGSIVNEDDLNLSLATTATSTSSVGSYDINLTDCNPCYNITWLKGALKVEARPVTINIKQTKQYGDEINLDVTNYTVLTGSVIGNDNLIVQLETDAKQFSEIGNYNILLAETNPNYNVTLNIGVLTVDKRLASLKVGNQTSVYGDDIVLNQEGYTVQGLLEYDSLNVTLSTNATNKSSVGSYSITATASNNNYFVSITTGQYFITARPIEIEFKQTFVYGDAINIDQTNVKVVNNGLIEGDELNLTLSTSARQYSLVGNYDISIDDCNGNYNPTLTTNSCLTIIAKSITVSIGNATKKYGDEINLTSVSVDLSELLRSDKLNYTLTTTATKSSGVGNYEISLEYANPNYEVTVITGQYTVTPRTVAVLVQISRQYGELNDFENVSYSIVSGSVIESDSLDLQFETTTERFSPVGKYDLTLKSNNSNYSVTINAKSYLQIVARNVTVKVSDAESLFGEPIDLSKVTLDTREILNNDDLNAIVKTTATETSTVGQYEITFSYSNANYNVTIVKGVYRIYNKQVSITIDNQTSVYGDSVHLDQLTYTINDGDVDKADLKLTLTTNASNLSPVGDYEISIAGYADNFYVVATTGKLTITARPIEVKVNATVEYGAEFVFNGMFEDVSNSLVNGDDLNLVLKSNSRQKYSHVGSYDVVLEDNNPNYLVTLSSTSALAVTPKQIEVSIGNASSQFGEDIDLSTVDVDLSQLENSDELNYVLTCPATNKSAVGNYDIDMTYNNPNYNVIVNKGVYSITATGVYVDVADVSVEYGKEIVLDSSLVSCTDSSVDLSTLGISLTSEAIKGSPVGEYPISVAISNNNYNVQVRKSGNVKIVAKSAVLTIGTSSVVYGSKIELANQVSLTIDGVLTGDDLGVQLFTSATNKSSVGEYEIDATCTNGNYNVTVNKGLLTITSKTVKITVQQNGVYGDVHALNNSQYNDVENAILPGDDIGLALNMRVEQFDSVGEYDISATCTNNNYQVQLINSYYKITPRAVTVQIGDTEMVYGEYVDESSIDIDYSEILNSDKLNVELVYSVNSTTNVGEYYCSASFNNQNYNVTFNTGKITVVARPITILISDEIYYGEEVSKASVYEIKSGSVVNNDNLNLQIKMSVQRFSPVGGSYPIELVSYNTNYIITLDANSQTTVKAKPVVVRIGNHNAFYLDAVDLKNISVDLSQIYEQDRVSLDYSISTTANQLSNVGTYEINFNCNNTNYEITVEKGKYIVVPRPVNIMILNSSIVYGDQIDNSIFDFVCQTENIDKFALQVELKTTANQFDAVGKYPISLKSYNNNYSVVAINGKLTITPREIVVKLNDQSKGHFTFLKPDQTAYQLQDGEICNDDDLDISIFTDKKYALLWGEFDLQGKAGNKNYKVKFETAKIKVSYSYVDTIVIVSISALIIAIIVLVAIKRANRAKGNVQYFNDVMELLKHDKESHKK